MGKKSTFRVCIAVEAALVLKNIVAVPFLSAGLRVEEEGSMDNRKLTKPLNGSCANFLNFSRSPYQSLELWNLLLRSHSHGESRGFSGFRSRNDVFPSADRKRTWHSQ